LSFFPEVLLLPSYLYLDYRVPHLLFSLTPPVSADVAAGISLRTVPFFLSAYRISECAPQVIPQPPTIGASRSFSTPSRLVLEVFHSKSYFPRVIFAPVPSRPSPPVLTFPPLVRPFRTIERIHQHEFTSALPFTPISVSRPISLHVMRSIIRPESTVTFQVFISGEVTPQVCLSPLGFPPKWCAWQASVPSLVSRLRPLLSNFLFGDLQASFNSTDFPSPRTKL